MAAAIAALKASDQGYESVSSSPADYLLQHFNLGPELHDADPNGWAQVGMSFANLVVEASP
jgi:hypothetical protein